MNMNQALRVLSFAALIIVAGCFSENEQDVSNQEAPAIQEAVVSLETEVGQETHPDEQPISAMSAPGIERSIVHITGDIYRFFNNHHSSLFLVTDAGVVFIDPLNIPAAEWVKGEIESKFGKSVTHVLYSHGHQDHATGASVFGDVEVISHANTFSVINPPADQALIHGYDAHDTDGNGTIEFAEAEGELVELFSQIDTDANGVLTGQETESFINKDVVPPTQTYDTPVHQVEVGGKTIEMHFVGGNHAADMSYIFFPEESLVFYVDVISSGTLPFGPLAWYSEEDTQHIFDVALSIDADITVPSHGYVGTQDDVRALRQYMADLREGVIAGIDAGQSMQEIQETLLLEEYADFEFYEERRPLNILGMYRTLMEERAAL